MRWSDGILHCIINAIETLTDRENWVKPCDIAEDE